MYVTYLGDMDNRQNTADRSISLAYPGDTATRPMSSLSSPSLPPASPQRPRTSEHRTGAHTVRHPIDSSLPWRSSTRGDDVRVHLGCTMPTLSTQSSHTGHLTTASRRRGNSFHDHDAKHSSIFGLRLCGQAHFSDPSQSDRRARVRRRRDGHASCLIASKAAPC